MKRFLIILFTATSFTATKAQDTIYWSPNYKLKWTDFKGIIDSSSEHGAISYIGINYKLSAKGQNFSYTILTYFASLKSWVRIFTEKSLIHEQGHFDIAEIFARKFRQAIKQYKLNHSTIKQDIKNTYNRIIEQMDKTDALYDKETDFHRNATQQQKWNKLIAAELERLKDYAQ